MQQEQLFPMVRERMQHWLGGYIQKPELLSDHYVSPPGLGAQAGVKGALALALDAFSMHERGRA
jgi:fructokinase